MIVHFTIGAFALPDQPVALATPLLALRAGQEDFTAEGEGFEPSSPEGEPR